jgi:predicted DNA-binding ArsR family transcriptional regulator
MEADIRIKDEEIAKLNQNAKTKEQILVQVQTETEEELLELREEKEELQI